MDCRRVRRRLVAYLDDELAPGEIVRVDDHLATCEACRQQLAALDRTTPSAPVLDLDDGALHEVHLRLLGALDEQPLPPAEPPPAAPWELLTADIRVPRGLVVLYAAVLLGVIGWAASGALVSAPAPEVAMEEASSHSQPPAELHQPAAYTPSDGWF